MSIKTIAKCSSCGYPITAEFVGQQVSCPMCSTINEAITGITIPTTLFWATLTFIAGVVLSPYLKRQAAKYIG